MHHTATIFLFGAKYKLILFCYATICIASVTLPAIAMTTFITTMATVI
jgi:hypothetical protein